MTQLHVLMPFLGAKVGGSHQSGLLLAKGLKDQYDTKVVILGPKNSEVLDLALDFGLHYVEGPDPVSNKIYDPAFVLRGVKRRMAVLSELRPHVVHTNDLNALQAWALPARFNAMPVVHHDRALGRLFPKLVSLRAATHIVTISNATARRLHGIIPSRKSLVVDPFESRVTSTQDVAHLRSELFGKLNASIDAKLVGFVGNLWERKRPHFFVDVAKYALRSKPDLYFVMFGREGDYSEKEINDYAISIGISNRIHLAGFRKPAELNIASLDLLAVPAVREPFGRTPIEAMLQGIPYVATNDAGHAEILDRWGGGRAVEVAATAETFAENLIKVLNDPTSVTLNDEARVALRNELSLSHHARAIMDVYRRTIKVPG